MSEVKRMSNLLSSTLFVAVRRFIVPQDREVYYSKAIEMYFTDRAQDSAILKVRWEERRAGLCEG